MAPVTFKTQVVDTLNELRKRNIVSPLPEPDLAEPSTEKASLPLPVEKPSDGPVPHWVCKVCGNPNHLSRQFCFMQVCAAPRGFPGPYTKAVRELPPPDQKMKRQTDAGEYTAPRGVRSAVPPPGIFADTLSRARDPRYVMIQTDPSACMPTFLQPATPPPHPGLPGGPLSAPMDYIARPVAPGAVLHAAHPGVVYTVPYPMAPQVAAYPPTLHAHLAAYGVPHMMPAMHGPPMCAQPHMAMAPPMSLAYFAPPQPAMLPTELAYYPR